MQVVLAAMSAGGLVGVADQYLCLLIVAIAANQKWIKLAPQMSFMESAWFIGVVGVFWIATVAPAYSSLLAPGVMNAINTLINLLSGFVVPVSSGLLSLASVGVIADLDPQSHQILETIHLFGTGGNVGGTEMMIVGGSALMATSLTMMKGLAKPAISTTTGTVGHISAPIYATLENLASILMVGLVYVLININPWLLVALLVIVTIITLAVLVYAVYQLWKLRKGIGRLIRLIQTHPKAGWAVVGEFFVWGSGWLTWKVQNRGALMLALWVGYGLLWWVFFGLASLLPFLLLFYLPLSVMAFAFMGSFTARALMRKLDVLEPERPPRKLGGLSSISSS